MAARIARAQTRVEIFGIPGVTAKLEQAALWFEKDFQNLVKIHERVGEVYNNAIRANIKDFDRPIYVYKKTGKGPGRNLGSRNGQRSGVRNIIKPGQLRRSIGLWRPNKDRPTTLAGPRTNNIGSRKRLGSRYNDGWYAHIVEGGDSFGRKKRTRNTGVFDRAKKATSARRQDLYIRLLKQQFKRYMK